MKNHNDSISYSHQCRNSTNPFKEQLIFSKVRRSVTPPTYPLSKNEYDFRYQHRGIYIRANFGPETPLKVWEEFLLEEAESNL